MSYGIVEIDEVFETLELEMEEIVEHLNHKYLTVRAGRANPHILDGIQADYYGAMTPLNQMANITVPEARILAVQVWDASALKAVEKAIQAANLGINPVNDGKIIRLIFPELTQEKRKTIVKEIKTYGDNANIGLRNIRRSANDALKKLKKDNTITEDDLKDMSKEVDNFMSKYSKQVEDLYKEKEKEVLSV